MSRRRQITVPIANQPGTLAGVAGVLGKGGVNVEALTVFEGQAHLVVDDAVKASSILQEARYPCLEVDVLQVDLAHDPGALAKTAALLAEAGINIDYTYSGPGPREGQATIILAVSDLARAEEIT
jgi:hypothetical protein